MALWLITDTHFGHNNMVHLCGRPQNFTRLIMDNWRKMVANTDTIKAKERKHFTEEQFAEGHRLACQTFVNGDISVSWAVPA